MNNNVNWLFNESNLSGAITCGNTMQYQCVYGRDNINSDISCISGDFECEQFTFNPTINPTLYKYHHS